MSHVLGSERAVVAALIRTDGINRQYAAAQIAAILTEDDFTSPYYAIAYRVVSGLVVRGIAPSPTAVREGLVDASVALVSVLGGSEPVRAAQEVLGHILAESHECKTNYEHHARRIAAHSALRRAKLTADRYGAILQQHIDGEAPELNSGDVIADMQQEVMALTLGKDDSSAPTALSEILPPYMQRLREEYGAKEEGRVRWMRTGFPSLDRMTRGFGPGHLIVLGAQSGKGKSALALQLAMQMSLLNNHAPGQFFSFEMMQEELLERALFCKARVPQEVYEASLLANEEWESLDRSYEALVGLPIDLHEDASLTTARVAAKCRAKAFRGLCSFAVVDYTQIVTPDSAGSKRMVTNREGEVAQIIGNLKRLASELKIPIIALSQLNDDGKVRESRTIKNDANVILLIDRKQEAKDVSNANVVGLECELTVDKCRHGSEGVINMTYFPSQTRFEER